MLFLLLSILSVLLSLDTFATFSDEINTSTSKINANLNRQHAEINSMTLHEAKLIKHKNKTTMFQIAEIHISQRRALQKQQYKRHNPLQM